MYDTVEVNATSKYNLDYIVGEGEQPRPEQRGDVFDRQRVMKDFHQFSIEQQHVFVLGVGGIGSSIAMSLVRMGVDTIYLLDYDVVDASNLNRQILFNLSDVGKSKAKIAAQHLKDMHNLRTNIYDYHINAVTNWSLVVEIAKKCTVIFNNIDYGAVFDYAVNSLCKSLNIFYVAGSTYANNIEINLFSGRLDDSCWACNGNTNDSFKFTPEEFENRKEISCISGEQSQTIIEECFNELNFTLPSATELSTLFMPLYQQKILKLLQPQYIQKHQSIEFIPKDRSFPTRTVGSWVGVCVSGACLIVNTWMQYLMKTRDANSNTNSSFHNWNQLNLSMYDGGYYTAGFPNEQNPLCSICSNAKQIIEQNSV
jgi:molybdopterin/thiamine biosynthesis adenylyltransferase